MKFEVNASFFVPNNKVRFYDSKRRCIWHVYIPNIGTCRIDRRAEKLKICRDFDSDCLSEHPLPVQGQLLVICLYKDDCLEIYDLPEFGYVAIYNGHVCRLNEMSSDNSLESKIIYRGMGEGSKKMKFITMDAIVSQNRMYEVIPSLIADDLWMVKTLNNEIRLEPEHCKNLVKHDYPVEYVDAFIRTVRRYQKMGEEWRLFEIWKALKYDLEKLLNDREVLEGVLT